VTIPDKGPDGAAPGQGAMRDADAGSAERSTRRIGSSALFQGAAEIIVTHNGEDYRLRCTSKGKLILTK